MPRDGRALEAIRIVVHREKIVVIVAVGHAVPGQKDHSHVPAGRFPLQSFHTVENGIFSRVGQQLEAVFDFKALFQGDKRLLEKALMIPLSPFLKFAVDRFWRFDL